ncbi:sensor histidine kinase [Arenicella xantha]|nr:histidine kinase [Arenicella xantha]
MIFSLLWFLFGDRGMVGLTVAANSIWIVGFFFAGLVLRQRYHRYRLEGLGVSKQILKGLLLVMIVSIIVVLIMAILCLPFYLSDLLAIKQADDPDATSFQVIWKFILANWVQTNVYLATWAALYLGITSSRRAKSAELDNLKLQNSLKEATLSSLSNQLNPHFLFNALNNIRFMILEDARQAEAMLMSLSEVLRYSLESSKQETLPLQQEMAIIDRYIEIVRIQFEDRLRFSMTIDPSLNNQMVPPMILQMLVENSVKHGVEQIQNGGSVEVTARQDAQSFTLTVCNDIPSSRSVGPDNTGIGLRNIRQRLQLLYGESASLVTSVADGRFCAAISLPRTVA